MIKEQAQIARNIIEGPREKELDKSNESDGRRWGCVYNGTERGERKAGRRIESKKCSSMKKRKMDKAIFYSSSYSSSRLKIDIPITALVRELGGGLLYFFKTEGRLSKHLATVQLYTILISTYSL